MKTNKLIIFLILGILFISACTNEIGTVTPSLPTPTVLQTEVTTIKEIDWQTEVFYEPDLPFSISNTTIDGFMGRPVDGSQFTFDRDTRWDVSIKISENSMTTGLIIEGNDSEFSKPNIFLGYSDQAWKIGYGFNGDYSFFTTLMVGDLEASFQLDISSDGKLLELTNGEKLLFTHSFDDPVFGIGTEVITYTLCGPQSSLEISSLSISKNESQLPYATVAQTIPDYLTIPAPAIPSVSAPISVENVGQLTRLTALGEGDLLNLQTSPDGKYVLLGTTNGILVLDSTNLERVSFMPTTMNPDEIYLFDNESKIAALDHPHHTGHIWSFPEGEEILEAKLSCPLDPVNKDDWYYRWPSQDLEFIFVHDLAFVGLCRTIDGEPVYVLDYQLNNENIAVTADESLLAFSTSEKLVIIQYHDGKILTEIPAAGIQMIFFYPDGKTLAAVFDNHTKFWNMDDFKLIDTLQGAGVINHQRPSTFPFFSPDNSILVFKNENNFRLIRAIDRAYIDTVNGVDLEFTPDSRNFIVDNGSGQVNLYEINEERSSISLVNSVAGMGFYYGYEKRPGFLSEDKNSLLVMKYWAQVGGWPKEIGVFDIQSGERAVFDFSLKGTGVPIDAVWLGGMNEFGILFSTGIFEFHTLDPESETTHKVIGQIPGADRTELKFTTSSDLLIYSRGDQVTIWDLKNNVYGFPKENISEYTYFLIDNFKERSPDGFYQISLSEQDNPGQKPILLSINGVLKEDLHGYDHLDYAFSPDSKMLAVITYDHTWMTKLFIFDLLTGNELFSIGLFSTTGDCAPKIAFSPDGNYLAILPEAGYPQIWGIP